MMKKTGLARFLIRHVPLGVAATPFEFAFMGAYALATGKYLIDKLLYSTSPDVSQLSSLPMKGATLWTWVILVFIGCVLACAGLLINGRRPVLGFLLERAGLGCAGCMMVVYLVELRQLIGFSFALGFVTILLELFAILYRIVLIGQALDLLTERRDP